MNKIIPFLFISLLFFACSKKHSSRNKIDKVERKHSTKYFVHLYPLANLPKEISESSGLTCLQSNSLWTHNDSRGESVIFNIDTNGNLLRKIVLGNEPNVDWEEITSDRSGNVFIGDFGNNNNERRGLMIYKIPNPDQIKKDSIDGTDIKFSYKDQFDFPPSASEMNFDCEAMIPFNSDLLLFSKNRSIPYSGYTKMYKVPSLVGNYVASVVDSFYTGHGADKESSITGAAINTSKTILVLISHEKIWVFSDFKENHFFRGRVHELTFAGKDLSMEGVCFRSETELYLTEERSKPGSGKLFYLDLSEILELEKN